MAVVGLLLAVWLGATWGMAYAGGTAGMVAAQFASIIGVSLTLLAVRGVRWRRERRQARAAAAEAEAIAEEAATGRRR